MTKRTRFDPPLPDKAAQAAPKADANIGLSRLESLPDELFLLIIRSLPLTAIVNLLWVNRRTRSLAERDEVWKPLAVRLGYPGIESRHNLMGINEFKEQVFVAYHAISKPNPNQPQLLFNYIDRVRSDGSHILNRMYIYGIAPGDPTILMRVHASIQSKMMTLAVVSQNGLALQYAPEPYKDDTEVALTAIRQNPRSFMHSRLTRDTAFIKQTIRQHPEIFEQAAQPLRRDQALVTELIQINPKSVQYADKSLTSNKPFLLQMIQMDLSVLEHIDGHLKFDDAFMLQAIQIDPEAMLYADDEFLRGSKYFASSAAEHSLDTLAFITDELKHDQAFFLELIENKPQAITYAASELLSNQDFLVQAVGVNRAVIQYIDPTLRNNRPFLLKMITSTPSALRYVGPEFTGDQLFVLDAIQTNPRVTKYTAFREDDAFAMNAVIRNGLALKHLPQAFKCNQPIALAAIEQDAKAYTYTDDTLRSTDFIQAAIQTNGLVLRYLRSLHKKDKHLVMMAIQQNPGAVQYMHPSLKNDASFMAPILREHGWALEYSSLSLRNNRQMVLLAVTQNWRALLFASAHLRSSPEIVLTAVKQDSRALQFSGENARSNREIVLHAIRHNPQAIRHSSYGLQQDPIMLSLSQMDDNALRHASVDQRLANLKAKRTSNFWGHGLFSGSMPSHGDENIRPYLP